MADLQALIFDMDGVIVDNTPVQARAFQLLFRDLGLKADAQDLLRRFNGMPATEILEQLFDEPKSKEDLKKYADQREFLYRTLYWEERQPAPGLVEFLEAARAAGLKIGLGSGSVNDTLSYILDHLNLRRFFDVVVGADDVDAGKPHPETYAAVAEKLGLAAKNCLVLEDAILGEHAAHKAGMHCVAVLTTLVEADFQTPVLAIKDFTEVTPEHLRELFSQLGEAPKADDAVTKDQDLQPVEEDKK
ncbi:beta-phosphoglucomutase family hydrolase [Hymenobacter sp. HMF4947]|uniref:Beta-phosphoglucomutase n=1 Tax=Hymenobacter ginkgonis TaxID=2682976 RepID=A0A7K1TK70_9BACT|nr:HAD family phosphatase [Hymenobacter ginkgonis]MVN78799.1 beta-phosphoglucomutase family hydrolase [Hymenobacter ginkgonis]